MDFLFSINLSKFKKKFIIIENISSIITSHDPKYNLFYLTFLYCHDIFEIKIKSLIISLVSE